MSHSPFPGMDPYLEAPYLWPDVHNRLINIFAEQLAPLIAPKYRTELETQLVIAKTNDDPIGAVPDITITSTDKGDDVYENNGDVAIKVATPTMKIKIPEPAPTRVTSIYVRRIEGAELVTVIELLSPANKHPGKNRQKYEQKRFSFLDSYYTHFVEIDLLRRDPRMLYQGKLPKTDYLVMVSRTYQRPVCDIWTIRIREKLPVIPIPLQRQDKEVPLDLGKALHSAYERARYDLRIDYRSSPVPPLEKDDTEWAQNLVVLGK
jgi:hypothetical protein